ncbi:hypothetical protein BC828DRAFT_376198 [Blastocladiella britannica]|nr:hypothetical protein BC828DRAFT_376198 [Blastocladiella britannica]
MIQLLDLPITALELVFAYLPHPQAFSVANREAYALSQSTSLRVVWLLHKYGQKRVFSRAALESVHGARIVTPAILPALVRHGADISADHYRVVRFVAEMNNVALLDRILAAERYYCDDEEVNGRARLSSSWQPVPRKTRVPQAAVDCALMVGADLASIPLCQLALHYGANIHVMADYALRYASKNLCPDLVVFLLAYGANPTVSCNHPIRLASATIVRMLDTKPKSPTSPLPLPLTVLIDARHRAIDVIRLLVWYGAPADIGRAAIFGDLEYELPAKPAHYASVRGLAWTVWNAGRVGPRSTAEDQVFSEAQRTSRAEDDVVLIRGPLAPPKHAGVPKHPLHLDDPSTSSSSSSGGDSGLVRRLGEIALEA